MVATLAPRVVLVTRRSEYDELIRRHATHQMARFFLETRGQAIEEVELRHRELERTRGRVAAVIPDDWRRAAVERGDLDRFLFEPEDLVVVLGQDGLVANVAKYLVGQPVVGLDPEPGRNAGVLVRHAPEAAADLLADLAAGRAPVEERTMVEAELRAGQRLLALNEVFVGHRSHQSARYEIEVSGRSEYQSSSGLIVSTGTGATGWASSIHRERGCGFELPSPDGDQLAWFVREAWPSVSTGTEVTEGLLGPGESLRIVSRMEDGVLFGDGIEADHLRLDWGQPLRLGRAEEVLRLVT